jgi:hypothetical protein
MLYTDVPFVVKNGSKSAIVVERGPKGLRLICMDSKGLRARKMTLKEADAEWVVFKGYPVHKAALVYFRAAMNLGGIDSAVVNLREIVMQYIISKTGQVKHASISLQDAIETFGPLNPTEVYSTIADLEKLGVSALTKVYNACVPEEDRLASFYVGLNDAATAAMEALEKKFNTTVWAMKNTRAQLKSKGVGALNKTELLINRLIESPATLLEIVEASGYDEINARTCIGVLRNRKQLNIKYDKQTKLYTMKAD